MKYISINKVLANKISGEWGVEPENDDGIKIIRTTNFTNLGVINFSNIAFRKIEPKMIEQKKLISDDVIIEKSGGSPTQPVGRVVFFKNPDNSTYLCNNFTTALRPNKSIVFPKYLFYILFYNHLTKRTLQFQNKTTGIINLKLENYLESEIPLPPIFDQIRIADLLTRSEKLIIKRKESIKALDEFLRSTFLEMFGDPVRNEKGWEKKKLREICAKITDGTHFSPPITEEGIPYITAKHVRENKIDFFSNPWYIAEKEHKEIYKRCDPKKGDVLYIKDGATTGYAAINRYNFEFSMLSSLALLRVDKNICNSEYLCHWLNNKIVKARILLGMSGGAIQRLTLSKINELPINIPPLPIQNQFASVVEKVEALKARYTKSLAELENLYGSLRQRAFKGELDLSKVPVDYETKTGVERLK